MYIVAIGVYRLMFGQIGQKLRKRKNTIKNDFVYESRRIVPQTHRNFDLAHIIIIHRHPNHPMTQDIPFFFRQFELNYPGF